MTLNIVKTLDQILTILNPRQKDVIERRYGLVDGKYLTLAEIGGMYNVTRERVRQIEAGAMNDLRRFIKNGILNSLEKTVNEHIKNLGGVRREALLLADLQLLLNEKSSPIFDNQIKFLLELTGCQKYFSENDNFYSYWYENSAEQKKAVGLVDKIVKYLKNKKDKVLLHASLDKVFQESIKSNKLKDLIALNYISISKNLHINNFGDFGLAEWPEINPRTIKDWAYLVLKKGKKPLHFVEIAKAIEGYRSVKKTINPQTVHNELIKNNRFVLVGRGTYALQEFGYIPGTAKEVMARLLKKHGPLKSKELIDLVLKERLFKKDTIFINLQNKEHFTRLEDGRYKANLV